jgi:lysophospholipase L1-like esterase
MIEYGEKNKVEFVDLTNPLTMHKSGIYFYEPKRKYKTIGDKLTQLVVSAGKTGGFGQALAN